ncbi:MAG: tRNA lysidine(34) synthetase TilS [Prevotella sp.]
MVSTFLGRIADYIDTRVGLDKDGTHLVALSGGADSVALLCVMHSLGYHIEAVHCNFHLRGEESLRDEEFCKSLTTGMGIPIHIAHFDTKTYCSLHHVSIEMGARDLRYDYFKKLREDIGADTVCVAHHKDDCAETVLLNLIRGTGISGMAGIRPRNGHICRPLLCVRRDEIIGYLESIGQDYVTDSSNLVSDVKRNVIRLEIMPLIKRLNPSAIDSIAASAGHIFDAIPLLGETLSRYKKDITRKDGASIRVSIGRLMETASPRYILYEILKDYGFRPSMAEQIYENIHGQTGRQWLSQDYVAVIDRGWISIERRDEGFQDMMLPIIGRYVIGEGKIIDMRTETVDASFMPERTPEVASLDADKVKFPLTLRRVRSSDRFVPFGMSGHKLVSDFMTDRKMNVMEKRRQLCLVDATGKIIWLVGQRIHDHYKIGRGTIKALVVRYIARG